MDLNERIARLLEPERESDTTWVGYHWNEEYCQVEPRPFDRSIDASMRVIEKRWPKCHVSLFWSDKRQEYVARISDIRTEAEDREIGDGEGADRAEALALALCAALEAEPTP